MAGYPYYNNPVPFYGQNPYQGFQNNQPFPNNNQPFQNSFQTAPYAQQGQPVQQPPQQPAPMSAPTIRVDIIRINTAEDVVSYPVNAGTTQMFQVGDGEAFITKEVLANGAANIDIYAKQAKKPLQPPLDLSAYVTREELEKRLEGLSRGRKRQEKQESVETADN